MKNKKLKILTGASAVAATVTIPTVMLVSCGSQDTKTSLVSEKAVASYRVSSIEPTQKQTDQKGTTLFQEIEKYKNDLTNQIKNAQSKEAIEKVMNSTMMKTYESDVEEYNQLSAVLENANTNSGIKETDSSQSKVENNPTMQENHNNPTMQDNHNNPNMQDNHNIAMQENHNNPTTQDNHNIAMQENHNNPTMQENHNNPTMQDNHNNPTISKQAVMKPNVFNSQQKSVTVDVNKYLRVSNFQFSGSNNHGIILPKLTSNNQFDYMATVNQVNVSLTSLSNLSNGDQVTIFLQPRTNFDLSSPNQTLSLTVRDLSTPSTSNSASDDYLSWGDVALSSKLFNGEPATKEEVFRMMDQVSYGDVVKAPGQNGFVMPSAVWQILNKPKNNTFATHVNSSYIDVGAWNAVSRNFGNSQYESSYNMIAFMQNFAGSNPAAGGIANMDESSKQFRDILRNINQLRSNGGDVGMSFGGAAGVPIWESTNDPLVLGQFYYLLAKAGNFHLFDMDIEGPAATHHTDVKRNAMALRIAQDKLASENFRLDISLTLAVDPNGLNVHGVNALNVFHDAGVKIRGVYIMNFDYGPSFSGDLLAYSKQSIDSAASQVASVWNISQEQAYHNIGSTSMPPKDDGGRVLTIETARAIVDYAEEKGLDIVSFWSMNDTYLKNTHANKNDYMEVFNQYNSQANNNQLPTLLENDVDVYSSGKYKHFDGLGKGKEVVTSANPLEIRRYSPQKYSKGALVTYEYNGVLSVYSSNFNPEGTPPSGNQANANAAWIYCGSFDFYQKWYAAMNPQSEQKTTTNTVAGYHFIKKAGKTYGTSASNSASTSNSNSTIPSINTWWAANAREYTSGTIAKTGHVYRYQGVVYIAAFYADMAPDSNKIGTPAYAWRVFNPAQDTVSPYWVLK